MEQENGLIAVFQATNQSEADSIRIFLESFEIPAETIGESVGRSMGFSVGPMGEVTVYVPSRMEKQARELLDRLDRGEFELPSDLEENG